MNQTPEKILTPDSLAKAGRYLQEQYTAFKAGLPLEGFRGELDYYRKDGTILSTEVITYPISGSDIDSILILGVTRDITERKQFESRLLEQANKFKELNATKDKFFSIIAHDLKSPFNSILGYSEMLKNEAHDLDIDSIMEYASIIYSSAQQTFNLLENLLDWAKTQQNSFPFVPNKISINNLIINEIGRLKSNADRKNISLVNCTHEELIFTADEKMISTVIRNLISNAIKFTNKNGSIKVKAVMNTDQVEISVSDTGIGMNKEIIKKLFRIEHNFTTRGTENEKGSGLGLALCKEFVEKHGGKLWVESEFNRGSTFYFTLPNKVQEK